MHSQAAIFNLLSTLTIQTSYKRPISFTAWFTPNFSERGWLSHQSTTWRCFRHETSDWDPQRLFWGKLRQIQWITRHETSKGCLDMTGSGTGNSNGQCFIPVRECISWKLHSTLPSFWEQKTIPLHFAIVTVGKEGVWSGTLILCCVSGFLWTFVTGRR